MLKTRITEMLGIGYSIIHPGNDAVASVGSIHDGRTWNSESSRSRKTQIVSIAAIRQARGRR